MVAQSLVRGGGHFGRLQVISLQRDGASVHDTDMDMQTVVSVMNHA